MVGYHELFAQRASSSREPHARTRVARTQRWYSAAPRRRVAHRPPPAPNTAAAARVARRPPPASPPHARASHAAAARPQLFYSFFKTLVGKEVVVELKNDLAVRGTLHSVDQYLNIKLLNVSVDDVENYPHMVRAAAHPRLLPARRPTARAAAPPRRPARSPSRRSNR